MLLKQSTAYKRPFSFVGVSLTVLTVQISKDGGAFADLAGAAQPTQITGAFYYVPMAAADTDTLGSIMYKFNDSILGIVLPNEDATDRVFVDIPGGAVSGGTVASVTNPVDANLITWKGGVPLDLSSSRVSVDVTRYFGATSPGRYVPGIILIATVTSLPSSTTVDCSTGTQGFSMSATDNAYVGCVLGLTHGGGSVIDDLRRITAYDAATGIFTVDSALASSTADQAVVFSNIGSSALDAAGTRAAVGLASANMDAQLSSISSKTTNLPALPASTTNITAGTITTATNLTNAPTSGDLTATMKTSVATAVAALLPSNFSSLSITAGGLTKIQSGITKNAAIAGWMFPMYAPTDHSAPLAGLTITATRSLDGAAFAACANAAAEIGSTGVYKINLAAGDLNGTTVTLRFAATGAETRIIEIVTTP